MVKPTTKEETMARYTHLFAAFLFCLICLAGKAHSQEKSQSLEEIFNQFNLEERKQLQQAMKKLQPQKLQSLLTRFKNGAPPALPMLVSQSNNKIFTDLEFSLPDGIEKVDFGDYDGDGDDDILLTGNSIARVYRNDNGRLINLNADLVGVRFSAAAWGDMEGDGDLDIVITGLDADSTVLTKVYRNNGGTFNDLNAEIIGVYYGSVDWGDYDNDGDLDILITGRTDTTRNAIQRISRVYRNDNGSFTHQNFNLAGVMSGDAIWGDCSGDSLLDILVTGSSDTTRITKLYRNVGNGFIEDILSLDLPAISSGSVDWGDYNKDGKLDLLMTGSTIINSTVQTISRLYKNEGTRFTEVPAGFISALEPVAWGDYNNDGYADGLIGENLYRNEGGTGVFSRIALWSNPRTRAVDFGRYDKDGRPDIIIASSFLISGSFTAILQNNGDDSFIEALPIGDLGGSIDLGDYDNDGDLDILLGSFGTYKIYRNDLGKLTNINAPLAKNGGSCARWGDYDNDGDLDIVLVTLTGVKIYRNSSGVFSDAQVDFGTADMNRVHWGDYDNDGDLDLLITSQQNGCSVYRNEGGVFVNTKADLPLANLADHSGGWGDFDNDGDLDILIVGFGSSWVFRNDEGLFVDIEAGLPGNSLASVFGTTDWGDYDNDGDLDILIAGDGVTRVFRNDNGNFVDLQAGLAHTVFGFGQWGDYDNDGDLDILIVGANSDLIVVPSKIYRNDNGSFTDTGAALVGSTGGDIAWCDFDGDGDLDIIWTGSNGFFEANFKIYRNDLNNPNQPPSAPRNPKAAPVGNAVVLSWDPATDNTTPPDGLTYNVRVGTFPGLANIKAPMSNLSTGQRRVVAMGNANHVTSYSMRKLTPGLRYYWSVQALDHAFAGSRFSAEGSFRAPDFAVPLSVSDNQNKSAVLAFGTAPNAGDCFDTDYDEFMPPRPPSGFDARFVRVCNLELRKDFRATLVDSIVWRIEIQSSDFPMTFRWNREHFPFAGGFRLQDDITGGLVNINMRAQDSLVSVCPENKKLHKT
jgi:hypothetical protein